MTAASPQHWKQSDLGEIPEDWDVRSISSLGGRITSGSRGWAAYYSDHGDLFVRITNLRRSNIHLDLSDARYVKLPTDNTEATRTLLKPEDLLISITADIGIVGYVDESVPSPSYVNQHIARVRFDNSQVSSKFIAYYLSSWAPQRTFVGSTDTGAKAGMNLETVGRLKTVLPPRVEQSRIAEVLSIADEQVAALGRMIAKKQAIKQGMMQQLLSGAVRLPGFTAPWTTGPLKLFMPLQRGFDLPTSKVVPGKYPVIYSNGIARTHVVAMAKGPGVVTGRSGTIGKVHYVEDDYWPHNTALWVTSFARSDPKFTYYFLTYIGLVRFSSGSGVPTLNRNDAHGFQVTLPADINEQRAIAAALTDADEEIDILRARLGKATAIKQGMMQELLTGQTRLPVAEAVL